MSDNEKKIDEAIAQAAAELSEQRVNVLIAGNTGVGKSTLLNAVFGADVMRAESGAPVTQELEKKDVSDSLLTLWDTKGVEAGSTDARAALEHEIDEARKSENVHEHVHVAWLCIASPSRRIEPVHIDLLQMLQRLEIPVVVVFTQSYVSMPATAKALAAPCDAQVEVLVAKEEGTTREPFGLEQLIEETERLIPTGVRVAFAAAQKPSWAVKKKTARNVVKSAVAMAAATALLPAHAASLLAIQAGMFIGVDHVYGLDKGDPVRRAISSAATGGARQVGTFIFRSLLTDALKATGFGYAAGAAAGATIGGSITGAVGYAYVEGVARYAESGRTENVDLIVGAVTAALRQAKSGIGSPPIEQGA